MLFTVEVLGLRALGTMIPQISLVGYSALCHWSVVSKTEVRHFSKVMVWFWEF